MRVNPQQPLWGRLLICWWDHITRSQLRGRMSSIKQNRTAEKHWFHIPKKEKKINTCITKLRLLKSACSIGGIKIISLETVIHCALHTTLQRRILMKHQSGVSVSKQKEQEKYMSTDLLQKKYSGPWKRMLERRIIKNSADSKIGHINTALIELWHHWRIQF